MAHMNCGDLAGGRQVFEAVVARHALRALKALEALRHPTEPAFDESHGPGWFDSSWELGQGLEVREGLPADAGLDEWLAVCLMR
jgi:hypothetical protein